MIKNIFVTQEKLDAVFTLQAPLFGDRYDAYRAALDGARMGTQSAYAPIVKALAICRRLKSAGFSLALSGDIKRSLEALLTREAHDKELAELRLSTSQRELAARGEKLFPFQEAGVRYLAGRHAALLADDQGTGKTCQTLLALPEGAPVLVVCPAVAKGVWKRETARWRPSFQTDVISGRGSIRWPAPSEIVAVNYDILSIPAGPAPRGLVVVFDEAHYCKSGKSKRTKAARKLAEVATLAQGRVWMLTGTPLQNDPPELYTVLDVAGLALEAFGRFTDFMTLFHAKRVTMGKVEKIVWGKPDASVPERLSRVMLRRERKDVLPELPDKRVSELEVEIDEDSFREIDKACFTLIRNDLPLSDPFAIFEATKTDRVTFDTVALLRKLCAQAKIPKALELADLYEEAGEKLVVMTAHLEPLRAFEKRPGWGVIEGKTPAHLRSAFEDAFQRGELRGLACSIKAAGVALTLTRACNILFVDESWNPADNAQAEDRVCRIGQTRGVEVVRMFVAHEIDRHVFRTLHRKERMIERVVSEARVR